MKNPLYGLLIANDPQMCFNVMTGTKRISIREGHRDYQKGAVLIGNPDIAFIVTATITEVKHVLLSEVTAEEWIADGFISQDDMLAKLREFYPSINLDSPVTILFWENVRGYWTTAAGIDFFKERFKS